MYGDSYLATWRDDSAVGQAQLLVGAKYLEQWQLVWMHVASSTLALDLTGDQRVPVQVNSPPIPSLVGKPQR